MSAFKNLYALVGARGVGKSSIAKEIANKLKWTLWDTDSLLLQESKKANITEFIQDYSWIEFRKEELKILQKIVKQNQDSQKGILDCGGGILVNTAIQKDGNICETLSEKKATLLDSMATIIFLYRDIKTLVKMNIELQKKDHNRPTLIKKKNSSDEKQLYSDLLKQRYQWFEKYADKKIDLGKISMDEAITQVISLINS